ncbi:oligosaccharide flippase family protein [Nonomuraea sp. NBC_01738]|uniref:oligosaccharide flippase family protein n=1 Tax=Nonomuraea sp. NBC_01738 TaxID=2976003 RepID=UPI002E113876|nr:oligosaccharide flippase family protein [Nonomuraea sp. NBC_01738]
MTTIGQSAGRGLRWGLIGNLITRAGSFSMGLILARLLSETDFGVFAVAMAATAFVMTVKDLGIMAAVVQWRGKLEDVTPTATLLSFISAIILYGVFWVGAPYYAAAAGAPEATGVVRLLTAIILVEAFTAIRSAAMLRRFEQDKLTTAIAIGFVANAAVAISLAKAGAGAYSFAWGQVAAAVVTGIIVFFWARLPGRIAFDRPIAIKLITFGIPSAAGVGLESVLLNAGYIVVGATMGPKWLGYFLLAFNVSSWVPGLIGNAIRNVAIPGFSRLAEQTTEILSDGVRRAVPLLYTAILPFAVIMATLAHPLIDFLYGDKWGQSAGVLRWLAVVMVIRMLVALTYDILTAQGATKATVWMNLGHAVILLPALVVGAQLDGIRGAAIGQAAASMVAALPLAVFFLRRAGVDLRGILPALARPSAAALLATAAGFAIERVMTGPSLLVLCTAGGGSMLVYALVVVPALRKKEIS